jgi:hypothetical protein
LEALKEAITQEAAAILPKMTCRIMENYRERLNQCIKNEGCHLSDIIFKSTDLKLHYVYSSRLNTFYVSCLVWFLLASQIREFFLQHPDKCKPRNPI